MAGASLPLDGRSDRTGGTATLLVLALAMACAFTAMGSFSTVQEGAKAELGLSDYALSTIQGVSAALPLAVFSVPIGVLVDRTRRTRLLAIMAAVWTAGTFLTALASSGAVLFAARMLAGIGATGGLTAALSLAADCSRVDQRGRAMLIVTLGKTVGVAAAFALTGALFGLAPRLGIGTAPWRGAHLMLGALALLLLLPLLVLREPARHEVATDTGPGFRAALPQLWARRALLLPLFAGQTAVVMADAAAGIWAAPVLTRFYHQTPDRFAGWLGLLLLGTGVVGTVLGGVTADIGQRSGRRGGLLLGMLAAAVLAIPAALFPVAGSVPLFAVALGVFMLCGTITGLVMSAALTVYLPNQLRGVGVGLFIAVAGLLGYGVAPVLVAGVSGALGGETHLAGALALVSSTISALSVLGILQAIRHAPRGNEASA